MEPGNPQQRAFVARGAEDLGVVTLELLDVHGAVIGTVARGVGRRSARFVFPRVPQRAADHEGHHNRRPRYIDNTRERWAPHTLRVRAEGFWMERQLRAGEALRVSLGDMGAIDERGDVVEGRRER